MPTMPRPIRFVSFTPACLAIAIAPASLAQDDRSKLVLEEVVVTATKREESMRDVPASISAFLGENLEKSAISDQEALVRLVPGVNFQTAASDTNRVVIRGISPAPKGFPNQTSALMFGDVPYVDNFGGRVLPDPMPYDLKSVEVLKGPQGTLYGAGSLNGAVRYIYEKPELGVFSGKYMVDYTTIDQGDSDFGFAGVVNIPFGETFAARIVGYTRTEPGYRDDLYQGKKDNNWREQDSLRVLLNWQPNDLWEVNLNYTWEDSHKNGSDVSDNLDADYVRTNQIVEGFFDYDYQLGELNIRRTFDRFDLISVTGAMSLDHSKSEDLTVSIIGDVPPSASGGFANTANDPLVENDFVSQEIRLVSTDEDSPWRWVVGGNYSDQTSKASSNLENTSLTGQGPFEALFGFDPTGVLDQYFLASYVNPFLLATWDVDVTELAVFGDLTREFYDGKLEVSVGGRYSRFESSGRVSQQGEFVNLQSFRPPGSQYVIETDDSIKEDTFSPKLSVTFNPTEAIMAYATVSKGFRLGGPQTGFNVPTAPGAEPLPFPETVESDELWNYEIGLRTTWLDNRLYADVATYYIDWKNAQFTRSDLTTGEFYTDNVGEVEGEGFEASLQYMPIEGLMFSYAGSWTQIETATDFPVGSGVVAPGAQWPGSFEWQHAASMSYSTEVGSVGLRGEVSYTSLDGGVTDLVAQNSTDTGYETVDLQFDVEFLNRKWMPDVSLSVRNLLNDDGQLYRLADPNFTMIPYEHVIYIQPRTLVLRLSGAF